MDVLVVLEQRFLRTPDGGVWTQVAFAESFFYRYLEVFDRVKVLARVQDGCCVLGDWKRVDGPRVEVVEVPYYVGPFQFLIKAHLVAARARSVLKSTDAVILRVPSQIASVVHSMLLKSGHPYGVEVVGDPQDVFAPGAIRHPLRPFFRWLFARNLRKQCMFSCAAAYVTQDRLQLRYPPKPGAFSTHYSSVELPPEAFVNSPTDVSKEGPFHLVFVGTLEQLYKAPDVLIRAVAMCVSNGEDLKLTIVGDGRYRPFLELLAVRHGVGDRVSFVGQVLSGSSVSEILDRSDLFVLPSRTEGLPRAMIEAMARGIPCIGSAAGGIPELLCAENMVPPGDVTALAALISGVVCDSERRTRMIRYGLQKAHEYEEGLLRTRRNAFYRYLRDATEKFQGSV